MTNENGRKRHIDTAECAKLARKALAHAFPGIRFAVRIKRYSGGSSFRATWTDGPKTGAVDTIVKRFTGSTFDGMTDLKSYHSSVVSNPDGSTELVHYGADFAFADRDFSDAHESRCRAALVAHYGADVLGLPHGWSASAIRTVCFRTDGGAEPVIDGAGWSPGVADAIGTMLREQRARDARAEQRAREAAPERSEADGLDGARIVTSSAERERRTDALVSGSFHRVLTADRFAADARPSRSSSPRGGALTTSSRGASARRIPRGAARARRCRSSSPGRVLGTAERLGAPVMTSRAARRTGLGRIAWRNASTWRNAVAELEFRRRNGLCDVEPWRIAWRNGLCDVA